MIVKMQKKPMRVILKLVKRVVKTKFYYARYVGVAGFYILKKSWVFAQ